MKVCAGDIETVNVTGNDGADEEDAIQYAVPSTACDYQNCEWREEDVYADYCNAVRESTNHGSRLPARCV